MSFHICGEGSGIQAPIGFETQDPDKNMYIIICHTPWGPHRWARRAPPGNHSKNVSSARSAQDILFYTSALVGALSPVLSHERSLRSATSKVQSQGRRTVEVPQWPGSAVWPAPGQSPKQAQSRLIQSVKGSVCRRSSGYHKETIRTSLGNHKEL